MPPNDRLPMLAPWTYQPPGQPKPSTAISRRFQPFGGENGLGAASTVGSCKIALWEMPRLTVLVSTRTMNRTVTPVVVVVEATFAGRVVVLGSGTKAVPPTGM